MTGRAGGPGLGLAVLLAGRFLRSRAMALGGLPVLVAAAFVVAMFVVLGSLALSGAQLVQRDLGRFGASTGFGVLEAAPGDATAVGQMEEAARRAGASDVLVMLNAPDVTLPGQQETPTLREADWASKPFPERHPLVSGRWPTRANEVVVTNPTALGVSVGERLSLWSGRARVTVVGLADDRYYPTPELLAGPGTWAGLDPSLGRDFGGLAAAPQVFWDGSNKRRVIAELTPTIAARPGTESPQAVERYLRGQMRTRAKVAAETEKSWVAESPASYTLPSLLLPAGAVLVAFGVSDRRLRRSGRRLTAVGVRPTPAAAALTLAVTTWLLAALALGVLVGVGLGFLGAQAVQHITGQAVSPIPSVLPPSLRLTGVVLLASAACGLRLRSALAVRQPVETPGQDAPRRRRRVVHHARHLGALVAACVAMLQLTGLDSPTEAMMLAGTLALALLFVTPEIVGVVLSRLPQRGPRLTLALRQLQGDRRRAQAAVMLLASVVGISVGFVALLDTMVRTKGLQGYPDVLPGQVLLADVDGGRPAPSAVLDAVAADPRLRQHTPFLVHHLWTSSDGGAPYRGVELAGLHPWDVGVVMAVDTAGQAGRLLGRPLDAEQGAALRAGGVLVLADPDSRSEQSSDTAGLVVKNGQHRTVRREGPLRAALVHVERSEVTRPVDALTLTSTARSLDLPVTAGPSMYSPLSPDAVAAARRAVRDAGLDTRTVHTYIPPPPPIPPTALNVTAVALVLLLFVMGTTLARSQVRALRDYAGRLVTIGLPTRWARQVLLSQQAVIAVIGTLVGLAIAIPPVVAAAVLIPHFALSVPWSQIALLLAATFFASAVSALWSTRRLRAADRLLG